MGSLTHRGDGEEVSRVLDGEDGSFNRDSAKLNSFSPTPSVKFLPILTAPPPPFFFPVFHRSLFDARHFLQIWGIIPILPPSASESNLIYLRSTPVNLALMLRSFSSTSLICLQLFYTGWNSSAILKSPTESNQILLTVSHTNVYLKRSDALCLSRSLVIHSSRICVSVFLQQMVRARMKV